MPFWMLRQVFVVCAVHLKATGTQNGAAVQEVIRDEIFKKETPPVTSSLFGLVTGEQLSTFFCLFPQFTSIHEMWGLSVGLPSSASCPSTMRKWMNLNLWKKKKKRKAGNSCVFLAPAYIPVLTVILGTGTKTGSGVGETVPLLLFPGEAWGKGGEQGWTRKSCTARGSFAASCMLLQER